MWINKPKLLSTFQKYTYFKQSETLLWKPKSERRWHSVLHFWKEFQLFPGKTEEDREVASPAHGEGSLPGVPLYCHSSAGATWSTAATPSHWLFHSSRSCQSANYHSVLQFRETGNYTFETGRKESKCGIKKKCLFLKHLPSCKGKKWPDNVFNKILYLGVSF